MKLSDAKFIYLPIYLFLLNFIQLINLSFDKLSKTVFILI